MHKLIYIVLYRLKEDFINPLFFALLISIPNLAQDLSSLNNALFNFDHIALNQNLKQNSIETNIFYTNKVKFLNTLFNQNSISEELIQEYENSIDSLDYCQFTHPEYKYYYIGEAQLILSLLHVKLGNQMSSARYFVKAYSTFERSLKSYPKIKDPLVALKFMEISASILPKSLQWITSWFGVKSNKQKAIVELRTLYNSNQLTPLAKTQCYALSLYLNLQFDIEVIHGDSKDNFVVFDILNAELFAKQKQYTSMIESLKRIPNHLNLKHFLLGKAYFINGHENAKESLQFFISNTKTSNNVSAAHFYLYQLNILNHETTEINKMKTLQVYPQENYRDKWAKSEIKNLQSSKLINLRNAYDRGDYKQCIILLNNNKEWSIRELYYLTNSYIYLKDQDAAKFHYNNLVKRSSKNDYYVPKTGLNLALLIYKEDPITAQTILKGLKFYNNYPYQKEIETKSELILKTF